MFRIYKILFTSRYIYLIFKYGNRAFSLFVGILTEHGSIRAGESKYLFAGTQTKKNLKLTQPTTPNS